MPKLICMFWHDGLMGGGRRHDRNPNLKGRQILGQSVRKASQCYVPFWNVNNGKGEGRRQENGGKGPWYMPY